VNPVPVTMPLSALADTLRKRIANGGAALATEEAALRRRKKGSKRHAKVAARITRIRRHLAQRREALRA
jgi:hypothetical protein